MLKKKMGIFKKKKVQPEAMTLPAPVQEVEAAIQGPLLCECGNAVDTGSHQCWPCAHRS